MTGLFDYVNSITQKTEDLSGNEDLEKEYVPFLINKAMSYYVDTVMIANQMNMLSDIPVRQQYQYYYNTVRKSKRWAKWHKKVEDEDLELIKEYFGYNDQRANEALEILSPNDITIIKERSNKGGIND